MLYYWARDLLGLPWDPILSLVSHCFKTSPFFPPVALVKGRRSLVRRGQVTRVELAEVKVGFLERRVVRVRANLYELPGEIND